MIAYLDTDFVVATTYKDHKKEAYVNAPLALPRDDEGNIYEGVQHLEDIIPQTKLRTNDLASVLTTLKEGLGNENAQDIFIIDIKNKLFQVVKGAKKLSFDTLVQKYDAKEGNIVDVVDLFSQAKIADATIKAALDGNANPFPDPNHLEMKSHQI